MAFYIPEGDIPANSTVLDKSRRYAMRLEAPKVLLNYKDMSAELQRL